MVSRGKKKTFEAETAEFLKLGVFCRENLSPCLKLSLFFEENSSENRLSEISSSPEKPLFRGSFLQFFAAARGCGVPWKAGVRGVREGGEAGDLVVREEGEGVGKAGERAGSGGQGVTLTSNPPPGKTLTPGSQFPFFPYI